METNNAGEISDGNDISSETFGDGNGEAIEVRKSDYN